MPPKTKAKNGNQATKQPSNQAIKYLILILASIAIIQIFSVILIASNPQAYNQSRSPRLKTIARKLLNKKQTEINPSNDEHYKSPEIKVVSPADGSVFEPKEIITVNIQHIEGIFLRDVMVTDSSHILGFDESEPFEFPIILPNKIGPTVLKIFAEDKITEEIYTTEITLNLAITATLQEIIPLTQKFNFNFYPHQQSLSVMGRYSDGKKRSITDSSTGTTYKTLSGTEDVVKVSADGLVTAQGNGQETIIISNSGVTKTIPVNVQATNSQPKLTSIGDLSIEAGTVLDVPLSATDPDQDDTITFKAGHSLPAFAQIIDNGNRTGMLHIAPVVSDIGTFTGIYISAIDKGNPSLGDTEKITITVTAPAME